MEEEPLTGGNASGRVVRVGETVRKPWLESSPSVQTFMGLLRARGIDVPEPMGVDAENRQVVEYVQGIPASELAPLGLADLARVGGMIRALHDASTDIMPLDTGRWEVLIPVERAKMICHNDLAPWNLIVGDRWVFIDWDGAGPSTRLWDLAYAAQSFADLVPGQPVAEGASRLRALVDGYGADQALRAALPVALTRRTNAMYELLRSARQTGAQPWARMYAEGHGEHWAAAARYVAQHEPNWAAALS